LKNKTKGISLIVLVITIIVIIILAGAVILSLSGNNPIESASKATYLSDLKNFQTELSLYQTKQFSDKMGEYDPTLLEADDASITYNGILDTSKTLTDLIPSLGSSTKYAGQFQVIDGQLVYGGLDTTKQDWSRETNVEVVIIGEPKITIVPPIQTIVEQGTDIVYTIKFSSNVALTTVDLTGKVEVLDNAGVALALQPNISIGTVSGTSSDPTRQVDVTIKTDTLANGLYKVKIKPGAVTNANNISNTIDTISLIEFEMSDYIPPVNPVMAASPTDFTKGNVDVTITYSTDSVVKEYSLDAATWNSYTTPVVVTDNNTTVYARGKDLAGNESGLSTLTVVNIDKILPIVTLSDGGVTTSSVTVTAVASDTGGSELNVSSYQYSKDNGTTWTSATSDTSYTFNSLTTGTYQCKVKVVDNAGNSATSTAVAIGTQALGTIAMSADVTGPTNGNVTVTINYPAEIVTKQYSTDAATWNNYTTPIVVSVNNTTVYAKGLDAGGNQTMQATLTVSNIDKIAPTITSSNGGVTTSSVIVTAIASDTGGSGLNVSSYQYSKDNGVTWNTASSVTNYTFSGLTTGTYQCKVKVVDNAGNSATSSAVTLTTTGLGTITMSANITTWTNSNVSVTINYPTEVVTKQYSTNGTTWNTYTVPVVVTTNSTVYAKGLDSGGNQTVQTTLTVSNIDKTVPSIPIANFNGYTTGTWTSSNITLNLSSTDANSGISKYQWSTNGTTWNDFVSTWLYNYDTAQNTSFRSVDNAGNASSATVYYSILRDATAPTTSSYSITNVTSDTYDVYVYGVADAGCGVNRLQFPTWSALNGQDDLIVDWQTNPLVTGQNLGGGTWKFTVKRSDHNNEYGDYITHLYFFDNLGNVGGFSLSNTTLIDPSIVAKFTLTTAQQVFNGSTAYSTAGQVSNNYTIEFDAQPSDTIDVLTENNTSSTQINYKHRFIVLETFTSGAPTAGIGISLGTNGLTIIAHSAGYYHVLLTYYTNLNAWNHYKIVVQNRVPRLYINGTLIKTGYAPLSSYTTVFSQFVIGMGSYGNFIGTANNFVFYNVVK